MQFIFDFNQSISVRFYFNSTDDLRGTLPLPTNLHSITSALRRGILGSMTRNLYNWNYRDVTRFLREHGFDYSGPLKGSHQAWVKLYENREPDRIVEVSLTNTSYKPKTLKVMIHQSGIPLDEWLKWARS